MTAITINIPNHEVSFFQKMIAKMGWSYNEADVVRTIATPKEQANIDHAFGQFRQMKDGELDGVNAEELLNELQVITYVVLVETDGADITLVTIYDKSDQANITDKELKKLMKKNGLD